jgi:hypothetical protein
MKDPADTLRAEYLELCEKLVNYTQNMRNYAMKPGNAWLARAELAKIISLTNELDTLLDQIKELDQR